MKKLFLILILIFTVNAQAQTVEVPQSFVDRANQAFLEVAASRPAIEALKAEIEARKQKDLVQASIITAQDKLIDLLSKQKCSGVSVLFGLLKFRKC